MNRVNQGVTTVSSRRACASLSASSRDVMEWPMLEIESTMRDLNYQQRPLPAFGSAFLRAVIVSHGESSLRTTGPLRSRECLFQ